MERGVFADLRSQSSYGSSEFRMLFRIPSARRTLSKRTRTGRQLSLDAEILQGLDVRPQDGRVGGWERVSPTSTPLGASSIEGTRTPLAVEKLLPVGDELFNI